MPLQVPEEVLSAIRKVGTANSIEPSALMAVVEVESAGRALEPDGRTPTFLFERHLFYRELKKRGTREQLEEAARQGLAITAWNRATQYSDLRTWDGRRKVLARAFAINEECANRSCSWGVGQIVGNHAEELGFKDATQMVAHMTAGGLSAQVDVMARFIKKNALDKKLNAHDWAGFAFSYNGAGYRQNQYDTRMAAAYARWRPRFQAAAQVAVAQEPEPGEIEANDPLLMSRDAEPPKTMLASKTGNAATAGEILTGAEVVRQASEVSEQVNQAREVTDKLGLTDWMIEIFKGLAVRPAFWIAVAIIIILAFVWWDRRRKLQQQGV